MALLVSTSFPSSVWGLFSCALSTSSGCLYVMKPKPRDLNTFHLLYTRKITVSTRYSTKIKSNCHNLVMLFTQHCCTRRHILNTHCLLWKQLHFKYPKDFKWQGPKKFAYFTLLIHTNSVFEVQFAIDNTGKQHLPFGVWISHDNTVNNFPPFFKVRLQ